MSNNNDLFVREVDEEIRQDQLKSLWRRFGSVAVAGAVAIVLGVGGYRAYDWWATERANQSGDRFLTALDQVRENKSAEALEAFKALEADGTGAYPLLAKLKAAALTAETDPAGAVSAFDAVASDNAVAAPLRDLAKLRAAYVLVDTGTYADVASRAETLTAEGNPLRYSALEAMALSAWKAGDSANAEKLLAPIITDPAAPANLQRRIQILLDVIAGAKTSG
jgi:hypothetical protein